MSAMHRHLSGYGSGVQTFAGSLETFRLHSTCSYAIWSLERILHDESAESVREAACRASSDHEQELVLLAVCSSDVLDWLFLHVSYLGALLGRRQAARVDWTRFPASLVWSRADTPVPPSRVVKLAFIRCALPRSRLALVQRFATAPLPSWYAFGICPGLRSLHILRHLLVSRMQRAVAEGRFTWRRTRWRARRWIRCKIRSSTFPPTQLRIRIYARIDHIATARSCTCARSAMSSGRRCAVFLPQIVLLQHGSFRNTWRKAGQSSSSS